MKENIILKHDEELKKSISEITSISLDMDYDIEDNIVSGDFEICGTYKSHGLSLNQDNFNFKIPFEYNLETNVDESTVKVDVTDFTYTIDSNKLCVDINYKIEGTKKEITFMDKDEFNKFLDEHEVDLVNLDREELPLEKEYVEETTLPEVEPIREINFVEAPKVEETIINKINTDENYITYNIYICNESDTFDSISKKYNVTIDLLKEYNDINEIILGTKLIIPEINV